MAKKISRSVFIPHDVLYDCFLPWLDSTTQQEIGDSLILALYNEDDTGANLQISGKRGEVNYFTNWLVEEIKDVEASGSIAINLESGNYGYSFN